MSEDLLGRVRSAGRSLQQRSGVVVDDYLAGGGKTDEQLQNDIFIARMTYGAMKETYDALVQEAGQWGVFLTRDSPGFEETLKSMRKKRRKAGLDDSMFRPDAWEATYAFPTTYGRPSFGHPLTPAQLEFWQENDRLSRAILRSWTMYKDLQWRLTGQGFRDVAHSDPTYDYNIDGAEPELGRADGVRVGMLTACDPFRPEAPAGVGTVQASIEDDLYGEVGMLSDAEVPEDRTDTIYVETDQTSTSAGSEIIGSSRRRRRRHPTFEDPGGSSPQHVVGLDTQPGWNDSSIFGPPASRSRLRHSTRAPSQTQEAPQAYRHRRFRRDGTSDFE